MFCSHIIKNFITIQNGFDSNKLYAKECTFCYEITDILESYILNMKILETSSYLNNETML